MKKILVVDDEEPIRRLLKEEFEEEGYAVVAASSGKEALARMNDPEKPDLVILDLRMPGMNGIEVMEFFSRMKNRIPVIIFSAYGAYKNDPGLMGADSYVIKSSDLTQLKDRVHELTSEYPQETREHMKEAARIMGRL